MAHHRSEHADALRDILTDARDKALEVLEHADRSKQSIAPINATQRAEAQHMGLLRLIEEYDIAAQRVFISVMDQLHLDAKSMAVFHQIPVDKSVNLGNLSEAEWEPYTKLIHSGLADNISSHYAGRSRGITLTDAGRAIAMLLPKVTPQAE